jgi:hypothetical protein
MWVVSHNEHVQLPPLRADHPLPPGQWIIPEFGAAYLGTGPVVCIAPSEGDGGVDPFGLAYRAPDAPSTTRSER